MDLKDVVEWIKQKRLQFVNSRRLAKAFKISPKAAGHILKRLREAGYLRIHRKRKGRFIVYKVNISAFRKSPSSFRSRMNTKLAKGK